MSVATIERPTQRAWIALQNPAVELANAIAGTEFVPRTLRGNPAAITAAILYGDEVGLGPMQSLAKIAVIDGKPTLAAEAQRALILAAGHDLWIEESTLTRCTVAGRRRDSEQTSRVTWTLDDAKRAGIAGRNAWRAYPRQMLLARASAELARVIFADAIGGLAATEEIDEDVATGDSVPTSPAEPTRRRRRVGTAAPTTTEQGEQTAPPVPELPPLPNESADVPGSPHSATGAGLAEAPASASAATAADPGQGEARETESASTPDSAAAGIEPELLTDPQRRRLMALFAERGFSEREHRLAWTRRTIGRSVQSANELTVGEASVLILALEALNLRAEGDDPLGER